MYWVFITDLVRKIRELIVAGKYVEIWSARLCVKSENTVITACLRRLEEAYREIQYNLVTFFPVVLICYVWGHK